LPNSARYIVGTTGDDAALVSIDGSEFLNAGRGDDTIKGAYDSAAFGNIAVIDGGDGVDTVDYSDLNVATTVKFEMVGELGVRIAVQKNPDSVGDTDYLYQIEKLVLGGGADTVKIRAGVDLSKIKSIDGGDQPADDKDVLDFSEFDRKVDIGGSSIGGSDRFAVDDSGVTGAGTTFKNFEKLILSDQDDTIKVRSLADLGGLKEIDAGGSPAGTSDVFDLSPSSAGFIFSDNKLSGNDLTIKLDNFEKIIGSTGNDTIDLTMSSITKADGGAGDDIIIGGETRSILLGGDGTDLLVAGSGGSVLDGGVSDGEGDAYIGGAGADTFVIGNGTHGKQGTDALFHISNAGANDRLVLRLDDTVGFGDGSSWMKGIVLNGGVYVVDPGVPPDNSGFIGATFSSALADMTGWDIGPRGSDFGRVSSIEPVSLRPSIGNFIAEYDWDQIDSTLVISIATAYGDFQVDIDDFQSGQLGLNFVSSPPPRPTGLPTVEAGIFTKASWDAYKTKMSAFVNSAQIVDLPSPGDPARGDAAPVLPAYDLEILPSYDSVFNPEEGATVGSNPGSVTPPTQPPGPVTAEALLAQNNISQFVQAMASYSATGAGSSSIQASFIDSNLQTTLAASLHA
jgi:hypothetical protein